MRRIFLIASMAGWMASCVPGHTSYDNDSSDIAAGTCGEKNICSGTQRLPGSVLHFTGETPSILAMLDAIAYAEFRNHPEAVNEDAYRTLVGYQRFSSFTQHPDQYRGENDSRAAGRYQFKTATWIMLNRYIGNGSAKQLAWLGGSIRDFSPASQDKMAVVAMHQRSVYSRLEKIKYGDSASLRIVCNELAWEWASLPGDKYDQGGLSFTEFQAFFWKRYKFYHEQFS